MRASHSGDKAKEHLSQFQLTHQARPPGSASVSLLVGLEELIAIGDAWEPAGSAARHDSASKLEPVAAQGVYQDMSAAGPLRRCHNLAHVRSWPNRT
jgi:hypothetical protein